MFPLIIHAQMDLGELAENLGALFGRDFSKDASAVLTNLIEQGFEDRDFGDLPTADILRAVPSLGQQVFYQERYPYQIPGQKPYGYCEVEIYQKENQYLIFLCDHDDHGGPSLTNAMEFVTYSIGRLIRAPLDLLHFFHYSASDDVYSSYDFGYHWKSLGQGTKGQERWMALKPRV